MIYGIGTDIAKVDRFEKLLKNESFANRFFSPKEQCPESYGLHRKCEHYAVRFAAKEAFSKALGTGLQGFKLNEVYICQNEDGKPDIVLEGSALELFNSRCGRDGRISVSLSHEKEYAVAFVVIERG